MLKEVEVFDDETNYQLSQYVEPRSGGEPTVARHEALKKTNTVRLDPPIVTPI